MQEKLANETAARVSAEHKSRRQGVHINELETFIRGKITPAMEDEYLEILRNNPLTQEDLADIATQEWDWELHDADPASNANPESELAFDNVTLFGAEIASLLEDNA